MVPGQRYAASNHGFGTIDDKSLPQKEWRGDQAGVGGQPPNAAGAQGGFRLTIKLLCHAAPRLVRRREQQIDMPLRGVADKAKQLAMGLGQSHRKC